MDFTRLFPMLHFHTPGKKDAQTCIIRNKWVKEIGKQIVEAYKMKFKTCTG